MQGTILGDRYELLEIIGEGGMAIVYKARCQILDRIVAVKILKEEFSRDKNFVEKFRTEALSAARISHPNIVNVYDVGQDAGVYYIVMEYVEGRTLKDIIRQEGPLPVEKAVNIAIMVCDGVHHAHEKGIIHRDIKPDNILVTEHGMVKVADFGIARAMNGATITYGDNFVGSVHYISPEQAKGEPVDRSTDIYSIGCVLYEMLTGEVPFEADSPITIALKHIHDEPVSPRSFNNVIPSSLEGIIFKAMQKVPAHRFRTAEEMRNAILNLNSKIFPDYTSKHNNDKTLIMSPVLAERDEAVKTGRKRIKPMGMAIVVIALIGFLSGVLFVMGDRFFGKEVAVPDVVGMKLEDADAELSRMGLIMNVYHRQSDDEVEKDAVISQDPGKGRKVKEGRQVNVVISTGPEKVAVPNVTGIDLSNAGIRLANKGLNLGKVDKEYDDKYEEGMVISQDPRPNTKVKAGTSVNIMVSKGKQPERATMPSLKGLSIEAARQKLAQADLSLGDIKQRESNEYYADQIMAQEIEAGVLVDAGSTVDVVVSTGPGPVARTKTLEFSLPADLDYYRVTININDAQGRREVYNELRRSDQPVSVGINYFGNGTAEVSLNGKRYRTYNL